MDNMDNVINKHQCFSCCLKHLASAVVIAGEIQTGYNTSDYHLYLLGNLAEAQEQISLLHPDSANRIRDVRLHLFGDGGTAVITPGAISQLKNICLNLRTLIRQNKNSTAAPAKKNCGCSRRKTQNISAGGSEP